MAKKKKEDQVVEETGRRRVSIADLNRMINADVFSVPKDDVIECLPTPSMWLNEEMGGGFPMGFFTFINGMMSSGKTTLMIQTMVHNIMLKGEDFRALFIDAEHAFNVAYAKSLGLNMNQVEVARTVDMREVYDLIYASCCDPEKYNEKDVTKNEYIRNFDLIVVDSVDAMQMLEDMNSESIVNSRMGLKAKGMGEGLKRTITAVSRSKTPVVFINQLRDSFNPYGPSKVAGGGNAKEFYAYIRIDLSGSKQITLNNEVIGNEVTVSLFKNKNNSPKGKATFNLYYGEGFNFSTDILSKAVQTGLVVRSGAWYKLNTVDEEGKGIQEPLGCGEYATLKLLDENPDLKEQLIAKLKEIQ